MTSFGFLQNIGPTDLGALVRVLLAAPLHRRGGWKEMLTNDNVIIQKQADSEKCLF